MKKFILLSLFGLLIISLTIVAYAQQVVIPSSSIQRPEDAGKRFHTNVRWLDYLPGAPSAPGEAPPFSGYCIQTPASLGCIYGLVSTRVPGCNPNTATINPTGGSKAIAIVDPFDAPNAFSDLVVFSNQFGLPVPTNGTTFQKIYATGTEPAYDAGAEVEESLDVQWAHAMAPNATIYLVEAASDSASDLMYAVGVANGLVEAAGGGEVSMSWGGAEFSGELSYDSNFTTSGVVYFAAAGDSPGTNYPSTSPNVVAVGGTTLRTSWYNCHFKQEVAWVDAGGGPSYYESRPSYQNIIEGIVDSTRGVPDVAAIADPYTPVWVYISDQASNIGTGNWWAVGGTSVATPVMAGIVNSAGKFSKSTLLELKKIYSDFYYSTGYFMDITCCFCGPYMTFPAGPGWDFCTGVGSPRTKGGK